MNYHELTIDEPRDSPARRQQFLVICTVMVAIFAHTIFQSDCLASVKIEETMFQGGTFVYKETKRDYAASASLEEYIGRRQLGLKTREFADKIYTIYLDDPRALGGRQQRFASGVLYKNNEVDEEQMNFLLSKNKDVVPPTSEELLDLGALELWPKLEYKVAELPSSRAASVQFTYTGGFVSAIVLSMRIIPALRQYVAQRQSESDNEQCSPITVISTCSISEQVCTHYAPLTNGQEFLLGHPDHHAYLKEL
ncbi:hypothetical protein ACA910_002863 [Epithemia clementina (nom. ined.)]